MVPQGFVRQSCPYSPDFRSSKLNPPGRPFIGSRQWPEFDRAQVLSTSKLLIIRKTKLSEGDGDDDTKERDG